MNRLRYDIEDARKEERVRIKLGKEEYPLIRWILLGGCLDVLQIVCLCPLLFLAPHDMYCCLAAHCISVDWSFGSHFIGRCCHSTALPRLLLLQEYFQALALILVTSHLSTVIVKRSAVFWLTKDERYKAT